MHHQCIYSVNLTCECSCANEDLSGFKIYKTVRTLCIEARLATKLTLAHPCRPGVENEKLCPSTKTTLQK